MPVKIRLARTGRKKLALYNVVVADSRAPRNGRFIEKLGIYNPSTDPGTLTVNDKKVIDWLLKGAQPTDTVRSLLSRDGFMIRKHLQVGVNKGAITQEQADSKYEAWKKEKDKMLTAKFEKLASVKEQNKKAKLDAEIKVKQAKEEAIKKKNTPPVENKVEENNSTTTTDNTTTTDTPTDNTGS